MSAQNEKLAIAWLQKHASAMRCPMCGQQGSFQLQNEIVMLSVIDDQTGAMKQVDGKPAGFPAILVKCPTCGLSLPMSALKIGLQTGSQEIK